ncbi:late secretory pathway protein AVL9 [Rhypophila decipiens]
MSSVPPTPTNGTTPTERGPPFIPLVSVVDFHHARGPEVEKWFGVEEGRDPAVEYDWTLLPFMALSDGAHAATEDFSYFTLLRPTTDDTPATSLFGISCTRQMDSSQLLVRPAEVTRSTVQKAVVVITDSPQYFGTLRERLSVVTKAWFAQREFTDTEILRRFQESLAEEKQRGILHEDEDRDQYLGLSLRELVREFRWQTLVLLKCCLLQPKMLFFGTRCERLCMMQFSLISLIPGLLRNLQDSAGPELNNYEKRLQKPTSLRTSDRNSLLLYMGLPLQIFGKGSLFGPYTPLQQLDILADFGTKSYIVGSTNSLLLQQRDRYSDILINLDENTINITSTSLKAALQLSVADRRWIDFITQNVNDTWDEGNPGRPKTMGYVGSEEFIRLQFEEYLLSLISSVKYHTHLAKYSHNPKMLLPHIEGDPSVDFLPEFVDAWAKTENYRIWDSNTDSHLFDIVEPKHPCAGGLTIDDVQRRITQQVQDLHLDEKFAVGKEVLGRNLAAGREKASTMFNKFYADMEALREAQRKRAEEAKAQSTSTEREKSSGADLGKASQTVQSVGSKAGAFVNSWAAWAGEKRKTGWGRSSNAGNDSPTTPGITSGWASGWGKGIKGNRSSQVPDGAQETDSLKSPRMSMAASSLGSAMGYGGSQYEKVPLGKRGSISGDSLLSGVGSDSGLSSHPGSPQQTRGRALSRPGPGPPGTTASVPMGEALGIRQVQNGVENGATAPVGTPVMIVKEDIPSETQAKEAAKTESTPKIESSAEEKKKDAIGTAAVEDGSSRPATPPSVAAATEEATAAQSAWGKDGL